MAAIDKTYVNTFEKFTLIRDWAKSIGTVIDDYGNKITPFNWLYYPYLTEQEFNDMQNEAWEGMQICFERDKKYKDEFIKEYGEDALNDKSNFFEIPIWNTLAYQDIWLIRNCPIDLIQERLKHQYGAYAYSKTMFTNSHGEDLYTQIKNRTSKYDTFQRNGLGKDVRFTIKYNKYHIKNFKDDDIIWWVTSTDITIDYNEELNTWVFDDEAKSWSSNMCMIKGNLTKRKIYRLLRKWDLPKDIQLEFEGTIHYKGTQRRNVVKDFIVTTK